ncbi:MAG TPA: ABC transporter ATP-binding protein [Terriglobales bacterium]|nr:ABC transporter ATP-binding protein [Terriglobales bacterium]
MKDVGSCGAVIASLHGASKTFGDVRALCQVNFAVRAGELVALLGPNGAGKTTAVKLFLGLAKPTSGTVSVFGGDPIHAEVRTRIGAMLQVAKVPETLRVREHIDLFSSYYPNPLPLAETLAAAGLQEIKDRVFGELSGGQRQRVLFALALCGDPDILFLDEPTVGLDVESRRVLWEEIRKLIARGKTVLLTTHYLEEADALADRVVVINRGEIIAEGTPAEIKASTAGRRIRCVSSLDIETVRSLPGVNDVRRDRNALEIRAASAEPILRELLARDAGLSGVEVTSAGLEEAFLALTLEHNQA